MKIIKISILILFSLLQNPAFSQFFTYTDLVSLDRKYFTESAKELMLDKGLVYIGDHLTGTTLVHVYERSERYNREPIKCYIMMNNKVSLFFYYGSRKYYNYLVERIKKYCIKVDNNWITKDRKFNLHFYESSLLETTFTIIIEPM